MGWIKNEIKGINGGKENDYRKDYMKIKFDSDDELSLNKSLKFHAMTIIIRSVFEEGDKLYSQRFVWIVKMLHYEKINVSEGIDTNKTSASKQWILCHYWYFKNVGFKFEPRVINVTIYWWLLMN